MNKRIYILICTILLAGCGEPEMMAEPSSKTEEVSDEITNFNRPLHSSSSGSGSSTIGNATGQASNPSTKNLHVDFQGPIEVMKEGKLTIVIGDTGTLLTFTEAANGSLYSHLINEYFSKSNYLSYVETMDLDGNTYYKWGSCEKDGAYYTVCFYRDDSTVVVLSEECTATFSRKYKINKGYTGELFLLELKNEFS